MLVLELDLRADPDRLACRRGRLVDEQGAIEAVTEQRDASLEQALLVLRGVVLEVLGKVAKRARGGNRLDDVGAAGPFKPSELGLEFPLLRAGQRLRLVDPRHGTRVPANGDRLPRCYSLNTDPAIQRAGEMASRSSFG